jgi:hypothetical protein
MVACPVPYALKSGLIIAEDMVMSSMSDEPRGTARLPLQINQERSALQQALLGSVRLFKSDVLRFAHDWQARWTDPPMTQQLDEISETLLTALAGVEQELSRPEGPAPTQVAAWLGTLLGEPGIPGPLARLQRLAGDTAATMPLENQRLLSEADTLFIQLNGFRAQWQDYLALLPASRRASSSDPTEPILPPLPPNQKARLATAPLPPLRRPLPQGPYVGVNESAVPPPPVSPPRAGQGGGLGDMLKALLPILLALVVVVFVAAEVVSRVPKSNGQTTPASATSATQPGSTGAPASTVTASPQPVSARLSVNPSSLHLPCPASGAALLQVANTGDAGFDWQATAASAAGGDPGILLDGTNPDSGHLNPGEVTQIGVTAQAASAQGTITITATGGAAPATVTYSVNC